MNKKKNLMCMTIDKFKSLLIKKIGEAIQNMSEIETIPIVGHRTFGFSATYYEDSKIDDAQNKLKQWQNVTLDILRSYYQSDKSENCVRFQETIVKVKAGFDLKKELIAEYSKGITILNGVLESLDLLDEVSDAHRECSTPKQKKIFISHSSLDKKFAEALVDLLNTLGLGQKEIFCSSIPGYWICNGKNFLDEIKTHFMNYDLFVIFIHSPRFYNSHISLNEMGAAWALQSEYCSFLTSDMEYDNMDAVVTNQEIAIKVNTEEAQSRLNDWKLRILEWFGQSDIDVNIWERKRNAFLEKVSSITYEKEQTEKVALQENDAEVLRQWVGSDDDSTQYLAFIGGSGILFLGGNQYNITTAQDKAKWRSCFQRLFSFGMLEYVGDENGFPKYVLTEKAYKYFEKQQ